MDFHGVFKALYKNGFNGYITVIEPISDLMGNLELARYMFRELIRIERNTKGDMK
jgi:sugar phosphate isomerase/epimerase